MPEESFAIILAPHIETPARTFWIRFHHAAYEPVIGFRIPAHDALVEVRAETPEGALQIARYHHGWRGTAFRLETRPVVAYSRVNHRVTFASHLLADSTEGLSKA